MYVALHFTSLFVRIMNQEYKTHKYSELQG